MLLRKDSEKFIQHYFFWRKVCAKGFVDGFAAGFFWKGWRKVLRKVSAEGLFGKDQTSLFR